MSDLQIPVSPDDHAQGSASARLTLLEYGDFQCPDAGYAFPIVKRLQKHFGSDLRFVYRSFPLTKIHPWAEPAAELAEFAAVQGRFWEMHDALFENQEELNAPLLPGFASRQGLDMKEVRAALEYHTYAAKVQQAVKGGKKSGVHGTPTFFINGKLHTGEYEFEDLQAALEEA